MQMKFSFLYFLQSGWRFYLSEMVGWQLKYFPSHLRAEVCPSFPPTRPTVLLSVSIPTTDLEAWGKPTSEARHLSPSTEACPLSLCSKSLCHSPIGCKRWRSGGELGMTYARAWVSPWMESRMRGPQQSQVFWSEAILQKALSSRMKWLHFIWQEMGKHQWFLKRKVIRQESKLQEVGLAMIRNVHRKKGSKTSLMQ